MERKEGKVVVPGDFIGTAEEYVADHGTYVENEKIYAAIFGEAKEERKVLSVNQRRALRLLGVGAVVVGTIENIVEPIALVNIESGSDVRESRFGESTDYAVLHASMIKKGYVKNVRDEYKIGDIIRAKIVDVRNGELRLATDSDELGAIKAFCAKCRHPMKLEGGLLKCEGCGWKDNRKIAKDYRKADVKTRW
ncbi:MAG: exosome complex RNA-binding protein Csl4 [Candidatus Micrarchaeota archaeon]|nr:exosome complex RNA-binding protein Csl4 [Candidatus Micrarchaeota archaeon]